MAAIAALDQWPNGHLLASDETNARLILLTAVAAILGLVLLAFPVFCGPMASAVRARC